MVPKDREPKDRVKAEQNPPANLSNSNSNSNNKIADKANLNPQIPIKGGVRVSTRFQTKPGE